MYCRQKNLRYELKNLRYELILNTGRYCHIEFTRLDIHLACISVSPWCSLLIQSSPFAWPHFLLHQPLIPWSHPICCCSWNAWNVFWPMSSVGPGDMPGHWTCPLVDHWETPDSSMSMTNVHVGLLRIKASALVNAPLQISEALGQQSTCTRVSWNCWHLGHLWSIPCSIRWRWDIVANRANSSLKIVRPWPDDSCFPALVCATQ